MKGFWRRSVCGLGNGPARMFALTAKGFHVHPPSIPEGTEAEAWFRRLFVDEPKNYCDPSVPMKSSGT